jgi:hypothetical protein
MFPFNVLLLAKKLTDVVMAYYPKMLIVVHASITAHKLFYRTGGTGFRV